MSETDEKVSYREFSEEIRRLRAEQVTRSDEIKSLIIQQSNHGIEHAAINHKSTSERLNAQESRFAAAIEVLSKKIDAHSEEDDHVERRVTRVEEDQKRFQWVGLVAIPSFLAAWEAVKRNFLK